MASKNILIIGSLSVDTIHLLSAAPGLGESVVAEKQHKELGGRGGNTAVSAYRAARANPNGSEILSHEESGIEVRLIAGVPDQKHLDRFRARLDQNGVISDFVEILARIDDGHGDLDSDNCTSFMESDSGKTRQVCGFETSNQWPIERFDDIDKICGDEFRPDLVIVTMELQKVVVEKIIETVHSAGIDVLLFASPGETIGLDYYAKLKHVVCNESDAAKMLGYTKLEDLNTGTWAEACEIYTRRGVDNVVLKVGPDGAYYRNSKGEEGFVSGYKTDRDLVDQTGATTAFVGAYAANYVLEGSYWNLRAATELGNKAAALFAIEIGYDSSIPWADEIRDANFEVLHDDIGRLREEPAKKRRGLRNRETNKSASRRGAHQYTQSQP